MFKMFHIFRQGIEEGFFVISLLFPSKLGENINPIAVKNIISCKPSAYYFCRCDLMQILLCAAQPG